MGQGQSSGNIYAPVASMYQDLERMKFSQDLRQNPADYSAYVSTRVDQLSKEIFDKKRVAFQKAQIDLGRYMDMDHNANFYKSRSDDVNNLTSQISSNNERIKNGLLRDKDVTKRQFEINEWSNYNKLETLFFLQVFFISSLAMAILIYFHKTGVLNNALAGLLTGLLLTVVVIIGVYRYYYTRRTRDTRLWHRRTFAKEEPVKAPLRCDKDGNIQFDAEELIPKEVRDCASDISQRFESWESNLETQMASFQEGNEGGSQKRAVCGI